MSKGRYHFNTKLRPDENERGPEKALSEYDIMCEKVLKNREGPETAQVIPVDIPGIGKSSETPALVATTPRPAAYGPEWWPTAQHRWPRAQNRWPAVPQGTEGAEW